MSRGAIGAYIIDVLSYNHSFNHHILVCSHPHPFVHNTSFQAVRLYYIKPYSYVSFTPHISQRLPPVYEHIYSYTRGSDIRPYGLLCLDQGRYWIVLFIVFKYFLCIFSYRLLQITNLKNIFTDSSTTYFSKLRFDGENLQTMEYIVH